MVSLLCSSIQAQTLEECVADCNAALKAADELIITQEKKLELQSQFITTQEQQLTESFKLTHDIIEDNNKWYNRKETYGLGGIILGLIIYGVVK